MRPVSVTVKTEIAEDLEAAVRVRTTWGIDLQDDWRRLVLGGVRASIAVEAVTLIHSLPVADRRPAQRLFGKFCRILLSKPGRVSMRPVLEGSRCDSRAHSRGGLAGLVANARTRAANGLLRKQ